MNTIAEIPYATHGGQTLHLNLYLPEPSETPIPVVVWLPGGGWSSCGNGPDAAFLTEAGFAVASVRYRLSQEAPAPANIQDCKAAVRWVRANAAGYNFDFGHIGVFGASAGGHLAALLGMSDGVAEFLTSEYPGMPNGVQAICDFCGPTDLGQMAVPANRTGYPLLYDVTCQYLGGPVEERLELARLVSPLSYVSAGIPPILIIHGDADDVVFVSESTALHVALTDAGADSSLVVLPGAGHGWDWNITNPMVTEFFSRTLRAAE